MMKAFPLEYRQRYLTHGLIYTLGFFAPWERFSNISLGATSWWLLLASWPARAGWMSFTDASRLVLVLGCVAAVVGAGLRVWGGAYLGPGVVHSGAMHGGRLLADGPYRWTRNPLYLGTIFSTLAIALAMPPTGAIVTILLIVLVQLRLIGAEEEFLGARLGERYAAYCAAVPRLLPRSLRPGVAAGGARPNYIAGLLGEVFFVGVAVSFLALGANYNSTLLLKGILISLGVSLIVRAFIPKPAEKTAAEGKVF